MTGPHLRYLVTGGAGFIGSALVRQLLAGPAAAVLVLDKLTYAGRRENLGPAALDDPRCTLLEVDIAEEPATAAALAAFRPDIVLNLAAETHVDRSIDGAAAFARTNLAGTRVLLDAALAARSRLAPGPRAAFRFVQVSTDEVYGALGPTGRFAPGSPYAPRSPYAATKAGADHLALAWHHTYGLPTLVTLGANTYGPRQFPEKLVPLTIARALAGRPLPVYGSGEQVRDWLHVEDHAAGILAAATRGRPGARYHLPGLAERRNLDVVRAICRRLDELLPDSPHRPHERLIAHVADRPGHDFRYALEPDAETLGWAPTRPFEAGLAETVAWYVANRAWWEPLLAGPYRGQRLGLGPAAA